MERSWSGHFDYMGQPVPMGFKCLKIYTKIGEIHGKGDDSTGAFIISGKLLPGNQCNFVKTYPATDQQVIYSGFLTKSVYGAAEIKGHWTMNDPAYYGKSFEFQIKKDYEELSGSEGEGNDSD